MLGEGAQRPADLAVLRPFLLQAPLSLAPHTWHRHPLSRPTVRFGHSLAHLGICPPAEPSAQLLSPSRPSSGLALPESGLLFLLQSIPRSPGRLRTSGPLTRGPDGRSGFGQKGGGWKRPPAALGAVAVGLLGGGKGQGSFLTAQKWLLLLQQEAWGGGAWGWLWRPWVPPPLPCQAQKRPDRLGRAAVSPANPYWEGRRRFPRP